MTDSLEQTTTELVEERSRLQKEKDLRNNQVGTVNTRWVPSTPGGYRRHLVGTVNNQVGTVNTSTLTRGAVRYPVGGGGVRQGSTRTTGGVAEFSRGKRSC